MITKARARQLRHFIEEGATALTDEQAIEAVELFPNWKPDTFYATIGERLRHEGKLYKVRQPHTSSDLYAPGSVGSEALYAEVEKPGEGDTPDNPIHYDNNMELFKDKYYEQYGVVYVCIRDTGVPVYNDLSALVGIYVNVYEA